MTPFLNRRAWLASAALAATAVLPGCATPYAASPLRAARPWAMPGTSYMDLATRPLPGSLLPRQHRLMLYVPDGDAPAGGHPVIWVLDGNLLFPLVAQLVHNRGARGPAMRGGSAIVVGLGHVLPQDSREVHDRAARVYDYTPPYPGIGPNSQGQAQGGADGFLDFLATQVQPLLASQLPADLGRQTLVGHSLGGLCVLHALFSRPGLFQRHVAGSPSLWWGGGQAWEAGAAFVARHAPPAPGLATPLALHLSQGSEELQRSAEQASNPERAQAALRPSTPSGSVADLQGLLAPVAGLACDYSLWPGANHGGALPFVAMQAVRVALAA